MKFSGNGVIWYFGKASVLNVRLKARLALKAFGSPKSFDSRSSSLSCFLSLDIWDSKILTADKQEAPNVRLKGVESGFQVFLHESLLRKLSLNTKTHPKDNKSGLKINSGDYKIQLNQQPPCRTLQLNFRSVKGTQSKRTSRGERFNINSINFFYNL